MFCCIDEEPNNEFGEAQVKLTWVWMGSKGKRDLTIRPLNFHESVEGSKKVDSTIHDSGGRWLTREVLNRTTKPLGS